MTKPNMAVKTLKQTMKDEDVLWQALEDPTYFGELLNRYQASFLRVAYGVVRNREEAEDIVQEAFTDLYRNAHKFQKQEGATFKSWAYRVLMNKAISHYRKLKKERERYTGLEPQHYENLGVEERLTEELDIRMTLETMLDRLPNDLRRVLHSYYFDDKPYSVIAEEEGISLATLKMRLFRAKHILRKIALSGEGC